MSIQTDLTHINTIHVFEHCHASTFHVFSLQKIEKVLFYKTRGSL